VAQTAGASYEAHDAAVDAAGQAADRPPTEAELTYLDQRVEETGKAVRKIKAQIKGLERSLRDAEKLHEDAVKARDAGRDLPEVQKRRTR
jgi:chaperonin cofactor prefoldin